MVSGDATTITIPIWRHPDLSWGEKLMCYVLGCLVSFRTIPYGGLAKCRATFHPFSSKGFADALTKGGWTFTTIRTGEAPHVEIVMARPTGVPAKPAPLVVHLHGGAYTLGTAEDAAGPPFWINMSARGASLVVASVAYRYAPEHPAPVAQQDVEAAIRHLTSSPELAARFCYDASRLHVWGSSAGAGLALVVGAAALRMFYVV